MMTMMMMMMMMLLLLLLLLMLPGTGDYGSIDHHDHGRRGEAD
jgi:hypothetical protein